MSALSPRLTELDRAVLAQLPADGRPVRISRVLKGAARGRALHTGTPERSRQKHADHERDVRLILRGFEHLGLVEERGNGWWRRTA